MAAPDVAAPDVAAPDVAAPDVAALKDLALRARIRCLVEAAWGAGPIIDVGTDHGWVPLAIASLLQHTTIRPGQVRLVGVDVSPLALAVAKRHGARAEGIHPVEWVESDGLAFWSAPEPVQTVVLAGMYGKTMRAVLGQALQRAIPIRRVVVQPTRGLAPTRRWLAEHGYKIRNEWLVRERNRWHVTVLAERVLAERVLAEGAPAEGVDSETRIALSLADEWVGPVLRQTAPEGFAAYLSELANYHATILDALLQAGQGHTERYQKLQRIRDAIDSVQHGAS